MTTKSREWWRIATIGREWVPNLWCRDLKGMRAKLKISSWNREQKRRGRSQSSYGFMES